LRLAAPKELRKVVLGSGATRWEVRYREAGRGSVRRARRFLLKADAEAFEREMLRRRQLGELAESDWAGRTVAELAEDWFGLYVIPNLEPRTQRDYARLLDRHVVPRLGSHRLREVRPEVVDRFRRELERQGTGRSQTRQALAVLQGMFRYAEERGRVRQNPVRLVRKPSGKRQRAVVALAPETVEAIRSTLIASGRLGDATLVSVLAYTGPRPQEGPGHRVAAHPGTHTPHRAEERGRGAPSRAEDRQAAAHGRPDRSIARRPARVAPGARQSTPRSGLPQPEGRPWHEHDWLTGTAGSGPRRRAVPVSPSRPTRCATPTRRSASARGLDPRAGRGARALAADDAEHLRPRDPGATGSTSRLGGGAGPTGPQAARTGGLICTPRGIPVDEMWTTSREGRAPPFRKYPVNRTYRAGSSAVRAADS